MKRLTFLILLTILMASVAFGGMRNTIKKRPTSYWWHTGKDYTSDPARLWAYEIEDRIAGPVGTGKPWYVDASATGQGSALSWVDAETSLDDVFALINADGGHGRGDIIYVAQGTELVPTASITIDAAAVTIRGVGNGDNAPRLIYNEANISLTASASNTLLYNLRLIAATPTIVIGIAVEDSADYTTIVNCVFPEPATKTASLTSCFVDAIDLEDGAIGFRALGNEFTSMAATGTAHFLDAGNGQNYDMVLADNVLMAEFSVAGIWSDVAQLRTVVADNTILNKTSGQHAIEFTAAATGMCVGNKMYGDTPGSVFDPGSMYPIENYATYAIDRAAELVPSPSGKENITIGNWNFTDDGSMMSVTIFSVTGDITGYMYAICDASITTNADSGSDVWMSVGTSASITGILDMVSPSTNFQTDEIWFNSSLSSGDDGQFEQFNPNTQNWFIISSGKDITLYENSVVIGGDIDFYLHWIGLSTDTNVTQGP